MLTSILSRETCAECRVCCIFYKNEIWEMPLISDKLASTIQVKYRKAAEYEFFKGKRIFKPEIQDDNTIHCPMIGETGCILHDDKPFECKIWPFRVTKLDDKYAVTVSYFCKAVFDMPLSKIYEFYNANLHEYIIKNVKKNPQVVTKYNDGYPIIKVF